MGRRAKRESLEAFNKAIVRNGSSYAEAQKRETCAGMNRIRVPRTERTDGRPVYMSVAARNRLKKIDKGCVKEDRET